MRTLYFNMAKLKGFSKVRAAIRHNKRSIQAEKGFDSKFHAEKSMLNTCLVGSGCAEQAIKRYTELYRQSTGKNPSQGRSNEVSAIEVLVSLPDSTQDYMRLFKLSTEWVRNRFDCPVLSADVHLDESQPHLHIIFLPVINGKMNGSDLMGGPGKFNAHRVSFYKYLGYAPPMSSSLQNPGLSDAVIKHLKQTCDPIIYSPSWELLRGVIERDPNQFAHLYGITVKASDGERQKAKNRFTKIMTSKGKGDDKLFPNNSLSCV